AEDARPKTAEERDEKEKAEATKLREAEKNNPAVTIPKEDELESVSRQKSEAVDSAINRAINAVAPSPNNAGGAGATGTMPAAPGANTIPAPTPAAPAKKGAGS